jgi:hypothetical protein
MEILALWIRDKHYRAIAELAGSVLDLLETALPERSRHLVKL